MDPQNRISARSSPQKLVQKGYLTGFVFHVLVLRALKAKFPQDHTFDVHTPLTASVLIQHPVPVPNHQNVSSNQRLLHLRLRRYRYFIPPCAHI